MPSVTRLARDVAAKVWRVVTARSWQDWQWLRRNPRPAVWAISLALTVFLLALLLAGGASWIWGKYHANREDLTPIATLVGGGIAAWVALRQVRIAADRHAAQTEADRQRRITESFSKAIEQLGSDKLEVRLGGIYALERISQESPGDHWTVIENLTAFVRERTRRTEFERIAKPLNQRIAERAYFLWEHAERPEGRSEEFRAAAVEQEKLRERPVTDIAAVITVIKRRTEHNRQLEERDKKVLDFRNSILTGADLAGAHLEGAVFRESHLEGSFLNSAHLEGANFRGAYLQGATLWVAHLQCTDLRGAHLEDATFYGAHLEGADLSRADGLSYGQISRSIGDARTKLPKGVSRPAHWPAPEAGDWDPARA